MLHVVAGGVLVTWACSTANQTEEGGDSYEATGGTGATSGKGGTGGSSAQGQGGSSAQSGTGGSAQGGRGGSGAVSGGSSGAGGRGAAGQGGVPLGGTGAGSPGKGGSNAAGGGTASAGRSASGGSKATGGVSGTGGVSSSGGNASGGMATAGSATNGGMVGAGGALPNDPTWKPPDMVETSKLVVLYQVGETGASSNQVRFSLKLKNQTEEPYDLGDVTIRYWMSSEPPPQMHIYYASTGLRASGMGTFVPNMAVSYVEYKFSSGGIVPVYVDQNSLNNAEIQAAVDNNINAKFNQANDWSFDSTATQAKANPKITLHDGDTLVWGCDPWHTCASTEPTGEGGAAGTSGI
jgi:hypothetical protein